MEFFNKKRGSIIYLMTLVFFIVSCNTNSKYDEIYKTVKEDEAKVIVEIDGVAFYPSASIFKGDVTLERTLLHLNLFDQYDNNIIMALGGNDWYLNKPVHRSVSIANPMNASVLIGKMIDKKQNKGKGYLMTEGSIDVKAISSEKLIVEFDGKVGRYMGEKDPASWNRLKAYIIYRKPRLKFQGVDSLKAFY